MKDYDRIIKRLQIIIKDKLYCEDNKLRSKCMKYDIINMMMQEDKKFMKDLYKKLEYVETIESEEK